MTWTLTTNDTIVEYPQLSSTSEYESSCVKSGEPSVFPNLRFDVTWELERRSYYRELKPKPTFLKVWCSGCHAYFLLEVECAAEHEFEGYKIVSINGNNRTAEKGRVFSIPTICQRCIVESCSLH